MGITRWWFLQCIDCDTTNVTEANTPVTNCSNCGSELRARMPEKATAINTTKKEFYQTLGKDGLWLNYAEKKRYLKENNLYEAGDSVGGSRDGWASQSQKKYKQEVEKRIAKERREFLTKELSGKLGT